MIINAGKNSMRKILTVFVCLLAVIVFITITGFKDKENDKELVKDKIMTYMTAVKMGNILGVIEISGLKIEADNRKIMAENMKEALGNLMRYEMKDFTIINIDIQGAIAFVTLEENVKITFPIDSMNPPDSMEKVVDDGFRKITGDIVLIKRDGKWKIDAVNTIQFGKVKDSFNNPAQLAELQKTMGIGKFFTLLADPDLSFLIVQAISNFKTARAQGQFVCCESNLKNIGTALEMYSTDNAGHYPVSLSKLTPDYLKMIPTCPAAGKQTYVDSYQSGQNPDSYSCFCKGHNHEAIGIPEDYPSYNSTEGLNSGRGMEKESRDSEPITFSDKYSECCSNLKNIGIALEMYSTDYAGKYPAKLKQLVPNYLRLIPTCPAAGKDTYSASYQLSKDGKKYSFCCKGNYHKAEGAPENDPSYNSETGLVKKKKL